MWRLTIKQSKKSTVSELIYTEKVEFESEDIYYLTSLVEKLSIVDKTVKTEYEIKNIEKETENE
jgi:hypothetical protein